MVYNTYNYWAFGLCPPSTILKNITFQELNLFQPSGEWVGDTYSVRFIRNS
jgi:hypothetical protein